MAKNKTLYIDRSGFSLVESMIAIVILGGGLLALASAFAQGMLLVSSTHYHQLAKEKASEAMESVFTARDAGKIQSWTSIQNASQNGIFRNGAQPLCAPGSDGLVNTADDGNVEILPGNDGVPGTGDDEVLSLDWISREIEITQIRTNLRQVRVIVRYKVGNTWRQYQLTSYITPFA